MFIVFLFFPHGNLTEYSFLAFCPGLLYLDGANSSSSPSKVVTISPLSEGFTLKESMGKNAIKWDKEFFTYQVYYVCLTTLLACLDSPVMTANAKARVIPNCTIAKSIHVLVAKEHWFYTFNIELQTS